MIASNKPTTQELLQRRKTGESYQSLARAAGVPTDELWTILYPQSAPTPQAAEPTPPPPKATGGKRLPFTERFRPMGLQGVRGQGHVTTVLRRFAADPCPTAFLFEGETGTGKTSAALALAMELGCDVSQKPQEFGGVFSIASGEQTADAVRDTYRQMFNCPFSGSGWKVVIVNEADRTTPQAETIWLDVLESLPARTVVIFTTNHPEKMSQRFRDRCTRLAFESAATKLKLDVYGLLADIWRAERRDEPDMSLIARVTERATEDGMMSFRRAVQMFSTELMALA